MKVEDLRIGSYYLSPKGNVGRLVEIRRKDIRLEIDGATVGFLLSVFLCSFKKVHYHTSDRKIVKDEDGLDYVWLLVGDKAREVWNSGIFDLYILWDDDSESMIESHEDLEKAICNGYDIGIEVGHV